MIRRTLIIFQSHPIQYYAPLYKYMTQAGIEMKVLYGSKHGLNKSRDVEFNTTFKWDVDLLEGYNSGFPANQSNRPGPFGFWNILNLGVLKEIFSAKKKIWMVYGWNYATNILIILFGKIRGHHITFKAETPLIHEQRRSGFKFKINRFLIRQLLKLVDSVQYIGLQNNMFYLSMGLPKKKLFFTPYSVDNEKFYERSCILQKEKKALRKARNIGIDKRIFLYSGKYIHKKRPLDLLKAINLLSIEEKEKSFFIFMGEGSLREEMENIIEKYKLYNVQLTGFINQSTVSEYYALSDVFVMCSGIGETWGLSTNEAMCFGLPVILSDLTGSAYDLVDGNGFIFETGKIQELASCIRNFLALANEDLALYGEKSRKIIQQYSYTIITENMNKYFKGV